MGRFFKKSENLKDASENEIIKFLKSKSMFGKVEVGRVRDVLHGISSNFEKGSTDYSYFKCQTREDFEKIDKLSKIEYGILKDINFANCKERLLEAATASAFLIEKHLRGECDGEKTQTNLQNILNSLKEIEQEGIDFNEAMEMDLSFLKYLAILGKKKAFESPISILEKNPSGKVVKIDQIETYEEILKVDKSEYLLPTFKKKLVEKNLSVRANFHKSQKSQNIIILVDNSGSMRNQEKKAMLKAALMLKIRSASQANRIYMSPFIVSPKGFRQIESTDTFEELHRNFITLQGGITDIQKTLEETIECIKNRKLPKFGGGTIELDDSHFEILVINDGQDDIDSSFRPIIKTHVVCLKEDNKELSKVCYSSGGTYFYLNEK